MFRENDARSYIRNLQMLSPHFVDIVSKQINHVTKRKIGDWLGLESILDAEQVFEELQRIASGLGC